MKRLIVLAACITFMVSVAMADTIHTTGPSQWNAPKVANNNSSNAFWDHVSSDGGKCNVGWVLEGSMGTCQNVNMVGSLPNKPLSYLSATGTGGTSTSFYVTPSGGDKTIYRASIAGFSGDHNQFHDVFGWALVGSTTLHPLFNDTNDTPNQTTTFSPGGNFRFYIAVYNVLNQLQWVHFSDADGNYFALFSQNPANPSGPPSFLSNYWVGSEDTHITNGDFDYQDMLVQIAPIPEPASLLLFGTGLVGMAGALRRRLAK